MASLYHHAGASEPSLSNLTRESSSAFLHYYATPGVTPPSARVNPKLKVQPRRPVRIWDAWKYGLFVVSKATEITGEVFSHHVWGPRKKSWGIEMTVVSSIMRGTGRHSALVDLATLRMLMSIGGFFPLPADALVTPVTFRVQKRQLRGILSEFDAAEAGTRELSGEWVVGKRTWQRLQTEWRKTRTEKLMNPDQIQKSSKEHVVLYIHGGAYSTSSAATHRLITIPIAKYTDARVFALDYRLAPETRFPGPLHDVVSGYLRLTEDLHIPPENIIVAGDSAGGGLCLALLMYLRDNDYSLPGGGMLLSPWVDLTMSCESWDSNANFDVVPIPIDNDLHPIYLYLGERMEEYLTHPYASPLFGDFTGLPPLLIQVGDAEVLRDEITLLAHKAALVGVKVRHELFEDAVHVFQVYPFFPASRRAFMSMRDFVRNSLPQISSPQRLDPGVELQLEQEIENEKATVVSGDGVGTIVGMQAVNDKLGMEGEKMAEVQQSQEGKDYRSWGRSSRLWPLPLLPSLNGDWRPAATPPPSPVLHPQTSADGIPKLRRIRSASVYGRRLSSRFRNNQHDECQLTAKSLHPLKPMFIPSMQMSNIKSPLPSPSLRRSSTSNPDLASLVENWSSSGPANQTLHYGPMEGLSN